MKTQTTALTLYALIHCYQVTAYAPKSLLLTKTMKKDPRFKTQNLRKLMIHSQPCQCLHYSRNRYEENDDDEEEEEEEFDSSPLEDQIYFRPEFTQKRYNWLKSVTLELLDTERHPRGSLIKGKWHQLASFMKAWSKYINNNTMMVPYTTSSLSNTVTTGHEHPFLPALMIESLLKRLIDERMAGNNSVEITTKMLNMAIEAWAATAGLIHGQTTNNNNNQQQQQQQQLYENNFQTENMKELSISLQQKQDDTRIDLYIQAAYRSVEILKYIQSQYESDIYTNIKPNSHSFLSALGAWNRVISSLSSNYNHILTKNNYQKKNRKITSLLQEAAEQSHETLKYMIELSSKSKRNEEARPGVAAFSLVIDAYAKSGDKDSGQKAEAILRQAIDEHRLQPTANCYNMVINAYTRQERKFGSVDSAERILNELEALYRFTGDESLRPDVISYTSLVSAWANSNRKAYGAKRAEDILRRMKVMANETQNILIQPNTITYNAVLKAWCRSGDVNAASRAQIIFQEMQEEYLAGNDHVAPDRISFNTLIHVLSKSSQVKNAQLAEDILMQMESFEADGVSEWSPNIFTYNTVIIGWAKVPNCALRAYQQLKRLMDKNRPDLMPDNFSFNHVIFALSKSGLKEAPLQVEELLRCMELLHKAGYSNLRPDVFGYSSAIHAWSRSGDPTAGLRAESLLSEMENRYEAGEIELKPNTITYNSVIDCWAKSGNGIFGARKAEQILAKMESMYNRGDDSVKPTISTFNSVLLAWARSNTKCAHWKSQSLLNHMWEQYKAGNTDVKPDALAYNTVINAVSKSQRQDKAQKALRILRQMDILYRAGGNKDARPNEYSYTSVLNSCAFSLSDQRVRRKALDTAIFTLEEFQKSRYGRPSHVTYAMFLKAVANLIPKNDERRRIIVEPVFLQCCKDGQVGEIVLNHLRLAAPVDLYEKLLGEIVQTGAQVRIEDIPIAWRQNVRNEQWRRNDKKVPVSRFEKKRIAVHHKSNVATQSKSNKRP